MTDANALDSAVAIEVNRIEPTSEREPGIRIFSSSQNEQTSGADKTEQIRNLAYALYEEGGRVDGRDLEYWLEAESIIRKGDKLAA
jgi:DUF2934 family protein